MSYQLSQDLIDKIYKFAETARYEEIKHSSETDDLDRMNRYLERIHIIDSIKMEILASDDEKAKTVQGLEYYLFSQYYKEAMTKIIDKKYHPNGVEENDDFKRHSTK